MFPIMAIVGAWRTCPWSDADVDTKLTLIVFPVDGHHEIAEAGRDAGSIVARCGTRLPATDQTFTRR